MNLKANKSLFDSHTEKPPPCAVCSRLRLTADKVLYCLFSDIELPLHIYSNYKEAISDAILCKPEAGRSNNRRFYASNWRINERIFASIRKR